MTNEDDKPTVAFAHHVIIEHLGSMGAMGRLNDVVHACAVAESGGASVALSSACQIVLGHLGPKMAGPILEELFSLHDGMVRQQIENMAILGVETCTTLDLRSFIQDLIDNGKGEATGQGQVH